MARPLRIEYPNAVYHVFNRGLDSAQIFPSERYYQAFLNALAETCARCNVVVHAFCLLRDQYHLAVRTPEANLSRFMRQVDGLYTQHFQQLRRTSGSLFAGRYKAVVVEADRYLLPVSRYLHALAGESRLRSWPWSSYGFYTGNGKPPPWFSCDEVLRQLDIGSGRRSAYAKYMKAGVDESLAHFYRRANLPSVLGGHSFHQRVRRLRDASRERGRSRGAAARWRPGCRQVVTAVARAFGVSEKSIYQAARGPGSKNLPRWLAMHLCQELAAVTLQEIAELFCLQRYGTVSTTVGKLKKEMQENRSLRLTCDRLTKLLSSQRDKSSA